MTRSIWPHDEVEAAERAGLELGQLLLEVAALMLVAAGHAISRTSR